MTYLIGATTPRWRIHPISSFESLAAAWDRLQAIAAPVPVLHSTFIRASLQHFGSGRERLAVCGESPDPISMGIFERIGVGSWQTFQPSQLPLGPFLIRRGVDLESLLPGLVRRLSGFPLMTSLTQLDSLFVQPVATTPASQRVPFLDTAWVEVSGTFDEYWSTRGKNIRHNVKRQAAKLLESGTSTRLDVIERSAEVASAIAEYGRLESAGWKAGEGTAVRSGTPQGNFYQTLLETFCARGQGRIYVFNIGGRAAAIDLCVEQADVLVVLKTTYDESLKAVSPATLMRHEYFRRIFDEGRLKRIEFYGRVMEWHTRWSELRRPLMHVNHYRWPWLRRVRDLRQIRQQAGTS